MINHLGELRREHHHLKVKDTTKKGKPRYERALFLFKPTLLGKSFWVPDSCGWKYLEPKDNSDMESTDKDAFQEISDFVVQKTLLDPRWDNSHEREALTLAVRLNQNSGFMLMTGYSLVRCCQLLEITVCPQALAQLLMFIQDGLEEMRKIPLPQPDKEVEMGEMTITLDRGEERKVWDEKLTVTESELKGGL